MASEGKDEDEIMHLHSANQFPHITLSLQDGVEAAYSNTLLQRIANAEGTPLKANFKEDHTTLQKGT